MSIFLFACVEAERGRKRQDDEPLVDTVEGGLVE
jgi:hypothetical protein